MTSDWIVWQLVDSAFPSGGFAHSGGLEAAVQSGEVTEPSHLRDFALTAVWSAARGGVPFVAATCRAVERFDELDARLDLLLNNAIANRASRAQGRAYFSSCAKTFAAPSLDALRAKTRANQTPGHLAVAAGAVGAALELDVEQTGRAYLFIVLRGVVSAAVRLSVVGPLAAQALQGACAVEAERALRAGLDTSVDDASGVSPLVDLLQSTQDRLYSRLFVS